MDAESSQCVHYEYVPHGKTDFELPAEVVASHRDLDVRIDLLDCGIDICTPDVSQATLVASHFVLIAEIFASY